MKIRDQQAQDLLVARALQARYQNALTYLILGYTEWSTPAFVSTTPRMPAYKIRIALIDIMTDPVIIVHNLDTAGVAVLSAARVAGWSWPAVEAFPQLGWFLRRHVDLEHVAGASSFAESWVRRVTEAAK